MHTDGIISDFVINAYMQKRSVPLLFVFHNLDCTSGLLIFETVAKLVHLFINLFAKTEIIDSFYMYKKVKERVLLFFVFVKRNICFKTEGLGASRICF